MAADWTVMVLMGANNPPNEADLTKYVTAEHQKDPNRNVMLKADKRINYGKVRMVMKAANEAGFDYLRDQLVLEPADVVQRPFQFALIAEADSILIDEARIPLVIAGESAAPENVA